MSLFSDLHERLRALVRRERVEQDLDDELRFHLEREIDARRRAGSPDAEREARLALGGVEQVKEQVRDARGVRAAEELMADLRFAWRSLGRQRGFTLAVILVLGLAVGAATAVYIVADRVLFAQFPFREPDRLVRVDMRWGSGVIGTVSVVDIQAVSEQARSFAAYGAARWTAMSLAGAGTPERITVGRVQAGFLRALDVPAARGRLIEPGDEQPGAPPVAVLAHAQAERLFESPDRALGRSVTLDGVSHTVVGVMEPGRTNLGGPRAAAWTALQLPAPTRRGPFGYRAIGRLAPGVTLAQAEQELADVSARLFPVWRAGFADSAARLIPVPLRQALVGWARPPVQLFGGAVVLVLLAAVANVATLLLVRASARQQELAVRAALGAGRARLTRLIASECFLLCAGAALIATAVAAVSLRFAPAIAPNLPRIAQVQMSWTAVGIACALALVCGVLVALAPLSIAATSGADTSGRLAGGARAGTGPRATAARSALVVAEFAFAFPLLVGAGLLLSSFMRLQRLELGFDPANVHALDITLAGPRYASDTALRDFWRELETRAGALPGITAVGLASSVPPDNFGNVNNFNLVDRPVPSGGAEPTTPWIVASNGAFTALGVRLLEGRLFGAGDTVDAPPVALVSRAWAAKYYPRESAVGKQFRSGGCTTCPPTTVVGVVSDVQYRGLAGEADGIYGPVLRDPGNDVHLIVRSRMAAGETFRALRSVLAGLDPLVAPVEVSLDDRVRDALGDPRRWTIIVGAFACAGALLAALGIFGLMAYAVRQRQRELGVRLALGASPASLTQLVVGRGLRYAALGAAIGLVLAVVQTRWLGSLLYGVRPIDARTLVVATVVMLAIAALACWIPGRQAARVRPVEALSSS